MNKNSLRIGDKNFLLPVVLFTQLSCGNDLNDNTDAKLYYVERNADTLRLSINGAMDLNIPVPFLDGVQTDALHILWDRSINMGNGNIVPFINLDQIYTNPKKVREAAERISLLRKNEQHIYAMNVALPNRLPLLVYLGIDVFDSTLVDSLGAEGKYVDEFYIGNEHDRDLCRCKFCMNDRGMTSVIGHNREMLRRELRRIYLFMKQGRLREYVEMRSIQDPESTAILREVNLNGYEFMEKTTPVVGSFSYYNTELSFYRPEVVRFRKKVSEVAIKPFDDIDSVVFFPCSKRKPYSESKSHRIFADAISLAGVRDHIHELMITSPLAVVPRELEEYYPAKHYDVPVTGYWDAVEKDTVLDVLGKFLSRNRYRRAILHLHEGEMFIKVLVQRYINEVEITSDGNPLSEKSIDVLGRSLQKIDIKHKKNKNFGNVRAMMAFQFGGNIVDNMPSVSVKGYFPEYKLFSDGKQIALFNRVLGKFVLTMDGAHFLFQKGINIVESETMEIKGDLFSPAVIKADENIRSGDEVIIVMKDRIAAVGTAMINGELMTRSEHGIAVKIRHVA